MDEKCKHSFELERISFMRQHMTADKDSDDELIIGGGHEADTFILIVDHLY